MGRATRLVLVGLLLLTLFAALNMVASRLLRGWRLDATQGSIYTLTQGSRRIARAPDEPITLTFYYTPKLARGRADLESYARRVRETLEAYARESGGKIILRVVEPEPFSEQEDQAVEAGLAGIPVSMSGENLYFGLRGTNSVDGAETIPFFDPRKERFLEYDLSRLIASLATPTKRVVGLISGLPLDGGFAMDPRTRQPRQTPPWQIAGEIRGLFELRPLAEPKAIPDEVAVLLVVHPKSLSEQTLYAIDQFVMRGGRAMIFVDPNCENDDAAGMMGMPGADRSSSLPRLLDAWGVEVPAGKLAADADLAMRVFTGQRGQQEVIPYVVWLGCDQRALSRDDAVTGNLKQVVYASGGFIRARPGAASPATITPLISTTPGAMEMPAEVLGFPPDPKAVQKAFAKGSTSLTLAARLSGPLTSAFPDGPPKGPDGQPPPDASGHLASSKVDANLILVADADLLADALWVRTTNFFGQNIAQKTSDNGDFVLSAIDNLTGSSDLISIRARREATRPFTRVQEMQRRADQRLLSEQSVLEEKLKETEKRLRELQPGQGDDGALVLSPEQQAEVARFKQEYRDTRSKLRQVRLDLQRDIDRLGTQLKLINTALVPGVIAVFALAVGLVRRARRSGGAA